MGDNSLPLVLYIRVSTTDSQQDRGRQKVFDNTSAADDYRRHFELRTEDIDGHAVFDQMMALFMNRVTKEDYQRLQMIILNGYGKINTGCIGDNEFTGAYLRLMLLSLVHRYSPECIRNNNSPDHKIAVVCAQCYSHNFVQHAQCVPASDPVFQFIGLTTTYQPYLVNPDELPKKKMGWVKWDNSSFLKTLLLSPKRCLSSDDYTLGPTSPPLTPRSASRGSTDITRRTNTSPW